MIAVGARLAEIGPVEADLNGLIQRARAERGRLDEVADVHADLAARPEHFLDAARLVIQAQDCLVDLRHLSQEVELVVEKRAVENRNNRFGRVDRERTQARSFPTREDDCLHVPRPLSASARRACGTYSQAA